MQAIVEGFAPTAMPAWRTWPSVLADVWDVDGYAGARGEYVSSHPRLFVVLEQTSSGTFELASQRQQGAPKASGALSYIPAGMQTYSFVGEQTRLRHLDLHFHVDLPAKRLGEVVDKRKINTPRLMFDHPRLLALATLLAEECTGSGLHDLYGESLVTAMVVELFGAGRNQPEALGGLSSVRLRTAKDYLEANCFRTGQLGEIADALGLSQSYFCSAFRISTGLTPHQWLMRTRIEKVKALLAEPHSRLSEVAGIAGFSDQAHMTRVFKQYVGATPAAWLQQLRGNTLLDQQNLQATAKRYNRQPLS